MIPLCQSYISRDAALASERFFPLHATACMRCHYVGLPEYLSPDEIFTEYAYFSSTSASWLDYVRDVASELIPAHGLHSDSLVVEMGSNDGYLLQHFMQAGIPVAGVEPAANVAKVANERGIRTLPLFFGSQSALGVAAEGRLADLVLSFNCLDHVPDVNDVIRGFALLLKPNGVVHVELPYLGALVEERQFDTIYHDRFSYFSLHALSYAFERQGLRIFDVRRIPTHGGSLRLQACHRKDATHPNLPSVVDQLEEERAVGMTDSSYYQGFMQTVVEAKLSLLEELIHLHRGGSSIVGYGVPAKGNVLLNYCGIRHDLLDFLVDRSPYKCGKLAPGSRLEIRPVDEVARCRPDYLLILPWNIKEEVMEQMAFIRDWAGRFIVPIPEFRII
jgi:SAM-dependent methyltransferase